MKKEQTARAMRDAENLDLSTDVDRSYLAYYLAVPQPFVRLTSGHFPAGTITKRHSHPIIAMHGCLQGPLTLRTADSEHTLDSGDFCLIAPGVEHHWSNDGSQTAATLAFLIETQRPGRWPAGAGIAEACNELHRLVESVHRLRSSGNPDLQHAFWQISDQLTAERPRRKLAVTARLWSFLSIVLDQLSPAPLAVTQDDMAKKIRRLLLSRVNDRLTINEVARQIHVSPTQAKEVFRATFGCGIMTYFNELKIWQAKRLLCDPLLTVDQISNRLGFSTSAYFSQTFRKHTGETPSEFRKQR